MFMLGSGSKLYFVPCVVFQARVGGYGVARGYGFKYCCR